MAGRSLFPKRSFKKTGKKQRRTSVQTKTKKSRALFTINVQNDFFPEYTIGDGVKKEGAFPLADAPNVLKSIATLRERDFDVVIHCRLVWPTTHRSFLSNNPGMSPGAEVIARLSGEASFTHKLRRSEYCVEGTSGAQLHRQLEVRPGDYVVEMGRDPSADLSTSPFDQLNRYYNVKRKDEIMYSCSRYHHIPEEEAGDLANGQSRGLWQICRRHQIEEIFVTGIGLDFGVQNAALHARDALAHMHGWDHNQTKNKIVIVKQCCAKLGTRSDVDIIRSLEEQYLKVISIQGQEVSRLERVSKEKKRLYAALDQLTAKMNKKKSFHAALDQLAAKMNAKRPSSVKQRRLETRLMFWDLLAFYCSLRLLQLQQKCRFLKTHGEEASGREGWKVLGSNMLMSKLLAQSKRWDNPSEARLKLLRSAVRQILKNVSKGVDTDARDGGIMSPLHIAVRLNLVEAVRLLLLPDNNKGPGESKEDHPSYENWLYVRDEFSDSPLIYCMKGLQVGTTSDPRRQKRSIAIAKMLIQHSADSNAKGYMGLTPLMWACIKQNLKAVKLLMPPDDNPELLHSIFDDQCNFGSSALHFAIGASGATNPTAIISHMFDKLRTKAAAAYRALQYRSRASRAWLRRLDYTQQLLKVQDCLGFSVIHLAAKNDLLAQIGVHPPMLCAAAQLYADDRATLPLHLAAWNGSAKSIERLLSIGNSSSKGDAEPKAGNKFNYLVLNHTALDLAHSAGHKSCAQLLLSNGCYFHALAGKGAMEFAHLMLLECNLDAFDGIMCFARKNKLEIDKRMLRVISELRHGPPGFCTFHISSSKAFPQFMWECKRCKHYLCNKCKDICPCEITQHVDNEGKECNPTPTSKKKKVRFKRHDLKSLGWCDEHYCTCDRRTCNCGESLSRVEQQGYAYNPQPIDISAAAKRFFGHNDSAKPRDSAPITREQLDGLVNKLAEHSHTTWAIIRIQGGWTYGEVRDNEKKIHPLLRPFDELADCDKEYNVEQDRKSVLTVLALGWEIIPPPPITPTRLRGPPSLLSAEWLSAPGRNEEFPELIEQRGSASGADTPTAERDADGAWNPKPTINTSDVMLPEDLLPLRDKLGRNYHDQWARGKMDAGWSYAPEKIADAGSKQSGFLVPFNCLTQYEQETNSETQTQMLRCILALNFQIRPSAAALTTNIESSSPNMHIPQRGGGRTLTDDLEKVDTVREQNHFDMKHAKVQFLKICMWACARYGNGNDKSALSDNENDKSVLEEVIQELKDLDSNSTVYESDRLGHSAMYLAAKNGHTDIVSLLLARNPYGIIFDNKGLSALSIASVLGHYKLTRRLMKINYPLMLGNSNRVIVHQKSMSGLNHTKHLVDEVDSFGYTVLHYAVMSGARDVVHILASQVVLTDGSGIDVGVAGPMRTESEIWELYNRTFIRSEDDEMNAMSVMRMWNRVPGIGTRILPSLSTRFGDQPLQKLGSSRSVRRAETIPILGDMHLETKSPDRGTRRLSARTKISPLGLAVASWNIAAAEVLISHDANPMVLAHVKLRRLPWETKPQQEVIHKMAFVQAMACPYEYALLHHYAIMTIHKNDLAIAHKQASIFYDCGESVMNSCAKVSCCKNVHGYLKGIQKKKKMLQTKLRQTARDSHARLTQDALDIQDLIQVLNKSHYVARYRSLFACKRFLFELLQQVLLLVMLILFTPLMCSVDQNLYASTGVSPAIQRQADIHKQLKQFSEGFNDIGSIDDFWDWTINQRISNNSVIWNAPRTTPFVGSFFLEDNDNGGCGCGKSVVNNNCLDPETVGYFLNQEVLLVGSISLKQTRFKKARERRKNVVDVQGPPTCVVPTGLPIGDDKNQSEIKLSTRNLTETSLRLRELRRAQWLDRLTKKVNLQMVVFNFNTDVLASLECSLLFKGSGEVRALVSPKAGLVNGDLYNPPSLHFKLCCAILLIYLFITRVFQMRQKTGKNRTITEIFFQSAPIILLTILLILDVYVEFELKDLGVNLLSDGTTFDNVEGPMQALHTEQNVITTMILLSVFLIFRTLKHVPRLGPIVQAILSSLTDGAVVLFLIIIIALAIVSTGLFVIVFGSRYPYLSHNFETSFYAIGELTIAGEFVTQNEDPVLTTQDAPLSRATFCFMIVALLFINLFIGILSEVYPREKKLSETQWENDLTTFLAQKAFAKFWLPRDRKKKMNWLSCFRHKVDGGTPDREEGPNQVIDAGLYLFSYQGQRLLHVARKLAVLQGRDGQQFYKRVEPLDAPPEDSSRERRRQTRQTRLEGMKQSQ